MPDGPDPRARRVPPRRRRGLVRDPGFVQGLPLEAHLQVTLEEAVTDWTLEPPGTRPRCGEMGVPPLVFIECVSRVAGQVRYLTYVHYLI